MELIIILAVIAIAGIVGSGVTVFMLLRAKADGKRIDNAKEEARVPADGGQAGAGQSWQAAASPEGPQGSRQPPLPDGVHRLRRLPDESGGGGPQGQRAGVPRVAAGSQGPGGGGG